MSNPWIRLYRDALHNPKIVSLTDRQHRIWHNLLLVADDNGDLPKPRDIACHLRVSVAEVEQLLCELVEAELVDISIDGRNKFRMHDWETHQYVSDVSTERVRKFRNKNNETQNETFQKRGETVSETRPEAEPEADTDSESLLSGEVKFGNKFSGKAGRALSGLLLARAEGLGLDVRALQARALAPDVRKPNGLFKKLVCDEIRSRHPIIPETLIKAALTNGNDAAWGQLNALLVGAAV